MDPRVIELGLLALDPRGFEDLTYALVRVDEPTARQLKPPDAGRDTVVPATSEKRERAWQAKHHTTGIDWGDCEESVGRAVEKRNPEEITLVFPVNMTEGKEAGLERLRAKYPKVSIPEPWTLGTLREKLNEHPEIRRAHIERLFQWDNEFALEMLQRGAALKEGWELKTAAAIEGPLEVLGLSERFAEAEAAAIRGELGVACEALEDVAAVAANRMPVVSDVLLMRAAGYAAEANERSKAGELHLRVARSAAERGDDASEYAAFRASWELPEEEQWRSFAATARAVWPERPEEAIPVLVEAFERSLKAKDREGVAEWGEAACDALAAEPDWDRLRDIAERALAMLGGVEDAGGSMSMALDLYDARAARGDDVSHEMGELLLAPFARKDSTAARIRARWGCVLARRGEAGEAALRFDEAAVQWRLSGENEEEIGEAIFSKDAVGRLLGEGRLDQIERIAAADLRGRAVTPAVLADQRETDGLRAWIEDRGYDARRHLMVAWAIHRREGHLGGCARVATALRAMFERAEEWPEALKWAIRNGNNAAAGDAARKLTWPEVSARLSIDGPVWERGPSFEAIAQGGAMATDAQISTIVPKLLVAAKDRTDNEYTTAAPGPAARRALSTLLCGIADEEFDEALAEVVYETEATPFPPKVTLHGLLFSTDAGVCDTTKLIAAVYCVFDRSHVQGWSTALVLIGRSEEAIELVKERATTAFTPLVLAAWLDLPDDVQALQERAAGVIERSLTGSLGGDEILRQNDRGYLARWASPEQQEAVAVELVGVLANRDEIDAHRFEAGEGLAALAPRLEEGPASEMLDRLLEVAETVSEGSRTEGLRSHQNVHFARVVLNTPSAGAEVRAVALRAASELGARCDRLGELGASVAAALEDPESAMRVTAIGIERAHPGVVEIDLARLLEDEDRSVRRAAFATCAERGEITGEDPRVMAMCEPGEVFASRCAVLVAAREAPGSYEGALERLRDDPHIYLRTVARRVLGAK